MLKKAKMTLTKDSKSLGDIKETTMERNNYDSNSRRHEEFYCAKHMRSRLRQICKDEILSDIVMTGTDLSIVAMKNFIGHCQDKSCLENPKYKYVRIDNY